jgi:hypothetical protein
MIEATFQFDSIAQKLAFERALFAAKNPTVKIRDIVIRRRESLRGRSKGSLELLGTRIVDNTRVDMAELTLVEEALLELSVQKAQDDKEKNRALD